MKKLRKQYHFRTIDGKLAAWDVDLLIDAARDISIQKIPLAEIKEIDHNYWYGQEGDQPTCRSVAEHARLIGEADLEHPILLAADGSLLDGMHRVCKAYLLGQSHIKSIRFSATPEPHYMDVNPEDLNY